MAVRPISALSLLSALFLHFLTQKLTFGPKSAILVLGPRSMVAYALESEWWRRFVFRLVRAGQPICWSCSHDRYEEPIDQDTWVARALEFLGKTFHGATAFPKARGVWRDDQRSGQLIYDEPV